MTDGEGMKLLMFRGGCTLHSTLACTLYNVHCSTHSLKTSLHKSATPFKMRSTNCKGNIFAHSFFAIILIRSSPQVGSHPLSPLFCTGRTTTVLLREKSAAYRVDTDSNISNLPGMAQWYSYGGSWKWVTILSILVGMVHLLSDICFCISSYLHQQLHSLDCQLFLYYLYITSLYYFLPFSGHLMGAGFHFWRGPTIFKIV